MSISNTEASNTISSSGGNSIEGAVDQPTTKRKRSEIWEHFTKVKGVNNAVQAKCNHCGKLLSGAHGTTHLRKHLQNACSHYTLAPTIGSPMSDFRFDQLKSRRDLAIACIKHKLPFNIGHYDYFELFLKGLNPNFKLPCRNTIKADVISVYEEEKVKVYKMLDGVKSRVSLTTDIWTSEHSHIAYCSVTSHFIDDAWELQKKILAFKKIPYPHDGESLFNFLKGIILEWNLDKKLFSIVVDNASANDSMIRKLKDWIVEESLVSFGVDLLHVRCSAHILNLIVQDGLGQIKELLEKIRETVRYLNKSPSASQKFQTALVQSKLENQRQVAMDVPSRWNSTFHLLDTSLPLRDAFFRLKMLDLNYKFNPSDSEWEVAEMVHDCLHIFYNATRHFSGSKYPTSNVFFPDVCEINLKISSWKNSEHEFLRRMADCMKEKFDKYWDKCCLVLAIGVVFDPRFRMDLVKYYYNKIYGLNAETYVARVRNKLDMLFIAYGGTFSTSVTERFGLDSEAPTAGLSDFDRWYNEAHALLEKSELDTYLDEQKFPRVESFSALEWWKTNSPRFPTLAKIAKDVLAVPATTVASEASFSIGGRIIDETRACLAPHVVEALVVADDWIGPLFIKVMSDAGASNSQGEEL